MRKGKGERMKTYVNTEKALELLNNGDLDGLRLHLKNALISEATYAKSGRAGVARFNAAKKYIKDIGEGRPGLGAWEADGKQYLVDGHTAFIFEGDNKIAGLKQIPDDVEKMKLEKFFDEIPPAVETVTISLAAVKMAIAEWKADGKIGQRCIIRIGNATYNSALVEEALRIIGLDTVDVRLSDNPIAPGLIASDGIRALVLPCKSEGVKIYEVEAADIAA